MNNELKFIKYVCKYCINKYQILNSTHLISSFIYQLCKKKDIYAPSVRGLISLNINGFIKPFAHCFNLYNGQIIDAGIYQHALINNSLKHLFPIFVAGMPPITIDYTVYSEVKIHNQIRFKEDYLEKVLKDIEKFKPIELNTFDTLQDSKKENLFFYK